MLLKSTFLIGLCNISIFSGTNVFFKIPFPLISGVKKPKIAKKLTVLQLNVIINEVIAH